MDIDIIKRKRIIARIAIIQIMSEIADWIKNFKYTDIDEKERKNFIEKSGVQIFNEILNINNSPNNQIPEWIAHKHWTKKTINSILKEQCYVDSTFKIIVNNIQHIKKSNLLILFINGITKNKVSNNLDCKDFPTLDDIDYLELVNLRNMAAHSNIEWNSLTRMEIHIQNMLDLIKYLEDRVNKMDFTKIKTILKKVTMERKE